MSINNVFKSLLNQQEVDEILNAIRAIPAEKGNKEGGEYYSGSVGFANLPVANQYINKIEEAIKPVVGDNIAFENTYARIYNKGSFLGYHIDRAGLDITVSVCLKRDIASPLIVSAFAVSEESIADHSWKKNQKEFKEVFSGYDLAPCDGGIVEGRRHPHWREPLKCDDGQSNIYIFYHWRRT